MLHVKRVDEQHKQAALQLLYSEHNEQDRESYLAEILQAEQKGQLSLEGLFLADNNADFVGAGLCILQPDGTAYIWPPVLASQIKKLSEPGLQHEIEDALIQKMTTHLEAQHAWLAQVLLNCEDLASRQMFQRNDYHHFTDLLFMSKSLSEESTESSLLGREWIPYDQQRTHQRFVDVIDQTYIDSQDCPELNHVRSASQALESYKLSGTFNPAHWFLLCVDGEDMGVLLLNAHPEEQCCELVYFGLIPAARGQSLGKAMIDFALHQASLLNYRSLFLAVDQRNLPAIRLYETTGFRQTTARTVCARLL